LLLEPTIPIPTRCEATSCERCGRTAQSDEPDEAPKSEERADRLDGKTYGQDDIVATPDPVIPDPAAVIGRVPTETSLWRELAAAARTLGLASSIEGELIEIRDAIASIEIESVDLDAARRQSQPRAARKSD